MRSVAQKILISLGITTLIIFSVIPVSVNATQEEYATCMSTTQDDSVCRKFLTTTEQTNVGVQPLPSDDSSWLGDALINAASPLLFIVMRTTSGLLALAGLILDSVIKITIVDMSENIKNLSAIDDVWSKIRDLGNMSFIFILLYHGIKMVLGLGSSDIKKIVVGIVIAAILVNFSLFVTKIVIDASNVVTLGFYNSISSAGGSTSVGGTTYNFGFSGAFMKPLGLSGIWDTEGFKNIVSTNRDASSLVIYIGGTIFMLITLFIFLTVALLFVIRYMVFIVLLIMSPIAFLTYAVPGLGSLSKKYWDTLFGQALFGPIYMLLTWVTLSIAGSDGFLNQKNSIGTALATPNQDTVSVIINFVILIGLLIMSVVQAKTHATSGGIVSASYINKGQAYLGGAIFGGAARAGTQTFGRLGRAVADSDTLRERVEKGGVTGKLAKWTLQGAKSTADTSFDFRNAGILGEQLSKAGAGKGIKGGYDSYLKEKKKEDKELLELIKPSDRAVAQAEEMLKSDAFKERERLERDKYFASSERAQEVADERAKRQKALNRAVAEKTDAEKSLKKAQEEITEITKTIEESVQYKDLQARILRETNEDIRKTLQAEIDEIRKPIELAKGKGSALESLFKQKDNARKKADEDLNVNFEKWLAAGYESWISNEQKELIATKGGQDEKKYGKENKYLHGQVKTREVLPQSDIRAKTIAERVGNRKSLWMPWGYITENPPEFSKDRGRALKKGIKKKKSVEDTIKEQMKEESEKDEGGDEAAPAAPTPPPATTPPTP